MKIKDYLSNGSSRFATVAMTDTNGLLRGQMLSVGNLKSALKNGMTPLRDAGIEKILTGVTDVNEVLRATVEDI